MCLRAPKLLLSFVFSILTTCSFSQTVVLGHVSDVEKSVVTYANIYLHSIIDSTVIQVSLTDSVGNFNISADLTKSFLEVNALGHLPYFYKAERLFDDTLQLDIDLALPEQMLENIEVKSKLPLLERKVDRTIFNVANSVRSNGSDAYELLKKAPGIQVSQGNVSMVGKSTVSIMVNDRLVEVDGEELESLLRSMPSNDISKIEIITAPPAKNDAQGNSGIINIITKKSKKNGLNGTLSLGFDQRTKGSAQGYGSFNYRQDKLNIYGSSSVRKPRFISTQETNTFYPEQEQQQVLRQDNQPFNSYNQLGADYNLSPNAVLGFLYTLGTLDGRWYEDYHNDILRLPSLVKDSFITTNAFSKDKGRRHVFNLNYEWKVDSTGKKLIANVNYFTRKGNKDRAFATSAYYPDGYATGTSSDNKTYGVQQTNIFGARIDYEWPTTFAVLSFGMKTSFIENKSDNTFTSLKDSDYQVDKEKSNTFDYKENTQAAYLSAQKSIGKWEMQIGFRGEYTQTKGYSAKGMQRNSNDYFKIFPTVYLQYHPNENHSWNANYSRRIDRPSFWDMNPFRIYTTETSYEQGNPFLQPSFSNNFELGYAYKSIFALTLYTQNVTNFITRVSQIDTNNHSFNFINANAGKEFQCGMTATLSFNPIPQWESTTQLYGTYKRFSSTYYSNATAYSRPSFSFETNNTFTLNKSETWLSELGFSYTSSQQSDFDGQRYFCSLNAGFKFLVWNKQLVLTVNASDILKTDYWQLTNIYNGTYQYSYFDNRQLSIGFTWKFGNRTIKEKRTLNTNQEEIKRAS